VVHQREFKEFLKEAFNYREVIRFEILTPTLINKASQNTPILIGKHVVIYAYKQT